MLKNPRPVTLYPYGFFGRAQRVRPWLRPGLSGLGLRISGSVNSQHGLPALCRPRCVGVQHRVRQHDAVAREQRHRTKASRRRTKALQSILLLLSEAHVVANDEDRPSATVASPMIRSLLQGLLLQWRQSFGAV